MAIKLNLNKEVKEFEQITPGEYEVRVANFEGKAVGDKNVISVDYEIRSDVDQNCKGLKIRFDDFFCTEAALWKIENASIAAGFTEQEAEFEKYSEWAKAFLNKNLRVEVKMRAYNGKEYAQVAKYLPTQAAAEKAFEISDEMLPF
jgi:hypothetical protein